MSYLFKSKRLGFRTWHKSDLNDLYKINKDPRVMAFFPSIQTKEQTSTFISRMQEQFEERSHCYFAVEILDTKEFIGFIGISHQSYAAPFTPCVDIGWRLSTRHWGRGYATEGALANLEYAFTHLKLMKIFSVAPVINDSSLSVMKKIGMRYLYDFEHSLLLDSPLLKTCALYTIVNRN